MNNTICQFDGVIKECQSLFDNKLLDYGASWRILRPSSITDQIFIKINRIRTLQEKKSQMVDDDAAEEFIAIINYSIIGLIQQSLGFSNDLEINIDEVKQKYSFFANEAKMLMIKKNHDYGEAWREMRISSITDLIFQKVLRTKQIEDNGGSTLVSEGWEANYYDMLNYAVFCLIKMEENKLK